MSTTSPATLDDLLAAILRVADALERIAPQPRWMEPEQAASYLGISRGHLDKLVDEFGHLDGGPVNMSADPAGRRTLRFASDTIDNWCRTAMRICPPAEQETPKLGRRRTRSAPVGMDETQPVDWSKV